MELHKLFRRTIPSKTVIPAKFKENLVEDTFHLAWNAFKKAAPDLPIIAQCALTMCWGDTHNEVIKRDSMAAQDITEDEYEAAIQSRGGHYAWVRWSLNLPVALHLTLEDLSPEVKAMTRGVNGLLKHEYI